MNAAQLLGDRGVEGVGNVKLPRLIRTNRRFNQSQ